MNYKGYGKDKIAPCNETTSCTCLSGKICLFTSGHQSKKCFTYLPTHGEKFESRYSKPTYF